MQKPKSESRKQECALDDPVWQFEYSQHCSRGQESVSQIDWLWYRCYYPESWVKWWFAAHE